MKLLSRPRPNWPSSHAVWNVPKSIESGIDRPVTRSDRSWKRQQDDADDRVQRDER